MISMKKMLAGMMVIACLVLPGCTAGGPAADPSATQLPPLAEPYFTDRDAFYAVYEQVAFTDTITSLTERFGEPVKEELKDGPSYTWTMDNGCGVVVVPYDSGKVRAKLAYYKDMRQVKKIALAKTLDGAESITKESSYDMVTQVFGSKGLEIMQSATDASASPQIDRLFVWMDENDNMVQVLFSAEMKVESISVGTLK